MSGPPPRMHQPLPPGIPGPQNRPPIPPLSGPPPGYTGPPPPGALVGGPPGSRSRLLTKEEFYRTKKKMLEEEMHRTKAIFDR